MADFRKIEYYDLRIESQRGLFAPIIGRDDETMRLLRVLHRRINNNVIVVGASGSGKTVFLRDLVRRLSTDAAYDAMQFVQFDPDHLYDLAEGESPFFRYQEALATLPEAVVLIDDFGRVVYNNSSSAQRIARLYASLLKKPEVRIVLSMQPHEYEWLARELPTFTQSFEVITLKPQPQHEQVLILQSLLPRLPQSQTVSVSETILRDLIGYIEKFPKLGVLPRAGIMLLDECLAGSVARREDALTDEVVQLVVSGKTGVPTTKLHHDALTALRGLEQRLSERIIGQEEALAKIVSALQRAILGMRNPNKPRGSFLMLGPSGVGKTETAKMVAETLFGHTESFIRFDMSEFGQEHTVQRLLGAPAGYVGHESGGALTNALRKEPHSLILLDEIEKAHPKVFDIFLQILDDGRITSGQNETIDATNAVFMMTSNVGVPEIVAGIKQGADVHSEDFMRAVLMPVLSSVYRVEFLNRFDHILAFKPLTLPALLAIAQLEIAKIEKRLAKHNVQFQIDPAVLEEKIKALADPRLGARPIKRFIEETCESLMVQSLLQETS